MIRACTAFILCLLWSLGTISFTCCSNYKSSTDSSVKRFGIVSNDIEKTLLKSEDRAVNLSFGRNLLSLGGYVDTGIHNLSHEEILLYGNPFSSLTINEGDVYGFGSNNFGQLGSFNDSIIPIIVPVDISATPATKSNLGIKVLRNQNMSTVSAGEDFSVAASLSGRLWSWGRNYRGQLGLTDAGINFCAHPPCSVLSSIKLT
eukprot:762930-Hanusia_phi.AAC.7